MTSSLPEISSIACIGEVMIELSASPDGSARLGVAGDTYNSAVYLVRAVRDLGISVSYVTALGHDPYSRMILDDMSSHGLATDHIEHRDDKIPGLYAINTDDAGERSFTYWRNDSAARTLFTPPGKVTLDRLSDFDLILLSGISVAILPPERRAALREALGAYRAGGGLVAFDSNYRPGLWENPQTARTEISAMWSLCDIGFPSVDDEMALFSDADETCVFERLRDAGVTHGALKRGAIGPRDLNDTVADATYPQADIIVDTTAAGDSFNAGYLGAICAGKSIEDALMAGHRLSMQVIAHRGAITPQ